jgi:hypothetical protein
MTITNSREKTEKKQRSLRTEYSASWNLFATKRPFLLKPETPLFGLIRFDQPGPALVRRARQTASHQMRSPFESLPEFRPSKSINFGLIYFDRVGFHPVPLLPHASPRRAAFPFRSPQSRASPARWRRSGKAAAGAFRASQFDPNSFTLIGLIYSDIPVSAVATSRFDEPKTQSLPEVKVQSLPRGLKVQSPPRVPIPQIQGPESAEGKPQSPSKRLLSLVFLLCLLCLFAAIPLPFLPGLRFAASVRVL